MDRREVVSLIIFCFISLCAALLVFFLLGWGPAAWASSGHASQTTKQTEVAVVVNLPPEPPGDPEPELEQPEQPEPEELSEDARPPALASSQEAPSSGPREVDTPPEPEPPQDPQETPEEVEEPAEPEPALPSEPPEEEQQEAPPMEDTAVAARETSDDSAERLTLEGHVPPFRYVGETELLAVKYPRMEMAWILDREPGGSSEPRVLVEIVMDEDRLTHWHDLRRGAKSDYFSEATTWHVVDERVHVASPNQLQLGRDSALFRRTLQEAGVDAVPPSRIKWGYYRHISEAYELRRAVAAFEAGVGAGKVDFQPHRQDYLEIEWASDQRGEPTIGKVVFHPEDGPPVELGLD